MWMGGYGARKKPSEGVAYPLMAKAALFQRPGGLPALILSVDLIGVDKPFAETVFEGIAAQTGIPRQRVIINASHTHAGPVFGLDYPRVYDQDPHTGAVARYNAFLRERLIQVAVQAKASLAPASLSWGTGSAPFAMNRRKPTPGGVVNAPNPRGYVDRSVPVLRVLASDGRPRAALFGYACHNTTVGPDNYGFSSEYAGFAQRLVESRLRVHAQFIMGCGASANPYPRGTFNLCRQHGESLGAEVCRLWDQELAPVAGPLNIAFDHVDLPIEPPPAPPQLDALRAASPSEAAIAGKIQKLLDSGRPWATRYTTPLAVWQFGQDLTLVRLSAEVIGEYIPLIERALGPLNLWIAAYCDDYFGYLPTAQAHDDGGYEARDFITGCGFLAREVETVVLDKLRVLARKAGRISPAL